MNEYKSLKLTFNTANNSNSPLDIYKSLTYTITMKHDELKKWRTGHGYSQSQLAKELGTHVMTVSQWERDIRTIPPFLHLALKCLELEGGETTRGKSKRKGGRK